MSDSIPYDIQRQSQAKALAALDVLDAAYEHAYGELDQFDPRRSWEATEAASLRLIEANGWMTEEYGVAVLAEITVTTLRLAVGADRIPELLADLRRYWSRFLDRVHEWDLDEDDREGT